MREGQKVVVFGKVVHNYENNCGSLRRRQAFDEVHKDIELNTSRYRERLKQSCGLHSLMFIHLAHFTFLNTLLNILTHY